MIFTESRISYNHKISPQSTLVIQMSIIWQDWGDGVQVGEVFKQGRE